MSGDNRSWEHTRTATQAPGSPEPSAPVHHEEIALELGQIIDTHLFHAAMALHAAMPMTDRDDLGTQLRTALGELDSAISEIRSAVYRRRFH
ncbi:hypothetical protein ORV05_06175 [Amycolatopsis cynarae]|uniref:DUF1844 domain-containing protein n=1 Tax=Amycolatopsis cynarae TaxID=2995223 RepID=A0ABY7B5B6_9PSEU|nr:hypothetical protein [Amycolatopsis sp. HUAS 11-8]WAL67371.1 hypothetical protein ORV05_06175 [Amycolatopsis sp. HUAS 11-8]